MNARPAGFTVRRVIAAVDASAHSLAAIEAAARLAGRLGAELTGVFVEDLNLLRSAGLSVARHLSLPSGAGQLLDIATIETQLRAVASQARRALEAAARTAGVASVFFKVARGAVAAELLAAASDADLLVLGWASRKGPTRRLGRTARSAAYEAHSSVLLLPEGAAIAGPVVVACDDSPSSRRAVAAGAAVADILDADLVCLALGQSLDDSRRLARALEADLKGRPRCRIRPVVDDLRLVASLRTEPTGLLVLGSGTAAHGADLVALLEDVGGAVLLVR